MSEPSACPNSDQLQQLILGQLPDAASEALEQHLEQCPRCEDTVEVLKAEDTLVALVRARGAELVQSDPPEVTALISKLSQTLRPANEPLDLSTANTIIDSSITAASVPEGDIPLARSSGSAAPRAEQPPHALYDFLAAPQAPDELGRLGPYRVLNVLGAGGMGVVFLAEDSQLRRRVALKVMKPSLAASESARMRFLREARTTAAIEHDHIVTIFQVGDDRGVPFLAMQFLHGESLEDRLRREGTLPLADVLRIGREVAMGLAAAHQRGLIHRDIKPANIWLESRNEGTEVRDQGSQDVAELVRVRTVDDPVRILTNSATPDRAKILDFGLARAMDDELHLTQTGTVAGTPAYMAPEQAQGEHVDHRADLFSLGAMLYRLCTGEVPFKGANPMAILMAIGLQQPKPPRDFNPDLPEAVSELILRLLAKQPSERPQSAREVVEAIAVIEHQTTATLSHVAHASKLSVTAAAPTAAGERALLPIIPNATGMSAHPPSPTPSEMAATKIPPVSREASAPGSEPSPKSSGASRPPARWNRTVIKLVAGLLLVLGPLSYFYGATIIRIATNKGQIVIDTDGAGIEVIIKDQQGTVLDKKTNREITFKAGEYDIEVTVKDSGGEQRFVTDHFVLKRNGKKTVDARWETAKAKQTAESSDPDRGAAEWVLSIGGNISIKENGKEQQTATVDDLPSGAFELTQVGLNSNAKVSDAGLAHFKDCKSLVELQLGGTQVSDAGVAAFAGWLKLGYVNVKNSRVTEAGVKKLSAALPACKIEWDGGVIEPKGTTRPPGGEVGPTSRDYDKLAAGRWTPVLTNTDETVARRNAVLRDGLIEIQDGHAYDKSILAADLIVRAKVQKLSGQNVMLTLRDVQGVYYSAFYHFDGAEGFGVGMRGVRFKYGVKQHFEASAGVKEGEFFELAFAAVGDTLTVYANGKRVGEIRDHSITQSGGVAVHTTKGNGVFKDVEVMVLSKPAP